MKAYSITRRLVIWLTLSTIAFWVIGAALGAYVMHGEFDEIFDSAMQETADRLLPLALDDVRKIDLPDIPRRLQKSDGNSDGYLTYQVRDKNGRVLLHSYETPPVPFEAPLAEGFWQGDRIRVFTIAAENDSVFVQVADSLVHRVDAMRDGILALLLPLVVFVPLSVVILLVIIGRAMAPLIDLRTAIAKKDSGNLLPLSTGNLPNELKPIANSLNIVLTRLAMALNAEREFAANSAHELRTPIAGAMAQAQLLIAEVGSSRAKERAVQIEQSLQKLTSLTEKLLQLARADAGIGLSDHPRDLMPIVEMVIEDARRQAGPLHRIELEKEHGITLERPVNLDALAIALRNLIENAISHGEPGKAISVRVDEQGVIAITNAARPFTHEELLRIRQRFHRASDRSPGSGLGLSIVERLLGQMNASLELHSPIEDGETKFEAVIRFH
jgi:two-component system OmpR family sensor kinase